MHTGASGVRGGRAGRWHVNDGDHMQEKQGQPKIESHSDNTEWWGL